MLHAKKRTGPPPLPIPTAWREPLDDWALSLRAAGLSENTINTRTDHLRRFARAHPAGPAVTGRELTRWAGQQRWSRETRRSFYASLRRFYGWALTVGFTTVSPADQLPQVQPEPVLARPVPEDVYVAALTNSGERVQVILRLAGETGMRRAEICQVHAHDLFKDLAGWTLVAHGKGGKDREIPLPPYLGETVRMRTVSNDGGWLLPGDFNGHLSPRWVGKLATRALPGDWTLHTLRHRFSSLSYEIDQDLMGLRDLLGHGSVATTQRYVRVPNDAKRRLVDSVASHRRGDRGHLRAV